MALVRFVVLLQEVHQFCVGFGKYTLFNIGKSRFLLENNFVGGSWRNIIMQIINYSCGVFEKILRNNLRQLFFLNNRFEKWTIKRLQDRHLINTFGWAPPCQEILLEFSTGERISLTGGKIRKITRILLNMHEVKGVLLRRLVPKLKKQLIV